MNYSYLVLFLVVLSAIIMGMSIALYVEYQDESKNNLNTNLLVLMCISIILFVFELVKYLYLRLRNVIVSKNVKKEEEDIYNGDPIIRISGKGETANSDIDKTNHTDTTKDDKFFGVKLFFGISDNKALSYLPFPVFMTCGLIFTLISFSVIIYKDNTISGQPLSFLISIISLVSFMILLSLVEIMTVIGYIFATLTFIIVKIHNLIVK